MRTLSKALWYCDAMTNHRFLAQILYSARVIWAQQQYRVRMYDFFCTVRVVRHIGGGFSHLIDSTKIVIFHRKKDRTTVWNRFVCLLGSPTSGSRCLWVASQPVFSVVSVIFTGATDGRTGRSVYGCCCYLLRVCVCIYINIYIYGEKRAAHHHCTSSSLIYIHVKKERERDSEWKRYTHTYCVKVFLGLARQMLVLHHRHNNRRHHHRQYHYLSRHHNHCCFHQNHQYRNHNSYMGFSRVFWLTKWAFIIIFYIPMYK